MNSSTLRFTRGLTKALAAEQVRTVLAQLLDGEHLFFKLGQADDKIVLVRSFTLLQIVAVLDRHQARLAARGGARSGRGRHTCKVS